MKEQSLFFFYDKRMKAIREVIVCGQGTDIANRTHNREAETSTALVSIFSTEKAFEQALPVKGFRSTGVAYRKTFIGDCDVNDTSLDIVDESVT